MITKYFPTKPIPPGVTLREALKDRGMTQAELAKRIDRPLKLVNEIIQAKTAITSDTAIQLENALSIPASFWNNLEMNYQAMKARIRAEQKLRNEIPYVKDYPYQEMAKLGWVTHEKDILARAKNLLAYFGVTSLRNIVEAERLEPIQFRISTKSTIRMPAVAAWLRKGVIDSQQIETKPFNKSHFREAANEIRALAIKDTETFRKESVRIFSESGVAFVVTENLKNAPINGATRWPSPDKALIQMSIRRKYSDIFWFSLFHEIGHVLQEEKRMITIDFAHGNNGDREREADNFASEILIPPRKYKEFVAKNDFSEGSIMLFAREIEVFPGIIVGRLQHDEHLRPNMMNHLRKKYKWE